jgi:AcrR family transcriptional regulator
MQEAEKNFSEESNMEKKSDQETRRHGAELEKVILQVTWEELQKARYSRMTMEAVAAKSGTSKNSLYRRWPSRAKIALAALNMYGPKMPEVCSDTGSLREDLIIWLTCLSDYVQKIGPELIHGLFADYFAKTTEQPMNLERHRHIQDVMKILERAQERGEIKHRQYSPRILSLPIDLMFNELLYTMTPLSSDSIVEIVDEIFLPLVTK